MTPDKTYFDKRYSQKDYQFKFKYDKEILKDILKYKKSGKVLDLGCGEGGLSLKLAEKGFDVTCVDISKIAIRKIKQEAKKRKNKINAFAEDLENYCIKEDYDVILALGVMQFFGDKGMCYIEKIQRHTKKGGINIIDSFINKWLPKNKLKELYDEWKILGYKKYKQKLISGDKKWMNYLVTRKKYGGWQCWVEMKQDYVIKTFKTKKEIAKTVKRYLDSIGKEEELDKRVEQMLLNIKESTKIIKSSNIPKKLLAFPIFLNDGKIKQRRAIVLDNKFDELLEEGKKKEVKKLVDESIDFIIELWKYGIHEKTFKFYSNFGILNEDVVLIDLFELTNKKEKVEKQIKSKVWKHLEKLKEHFAPEVMEYFLKQVEKRLTVKKLNEVWSINRR